MKQERASYREITAKTRRKFPCGNLHPPRRVWGRLWWRCCLSFRGEVNATLTRTSHHGKSLAAEWHMCHWGSWNPSEPHRTPGSGITVRSKQHTVSDGAVSYSVLKEVSLITKPSWKVLIISVYVQERATQFSWSIRHTPVQIHSTRHLTSNSSKVSRSWKTWEGIKNSHRSGETGEAWWTLVWRPGLDTAAEEGHWR